MSRKVEVSLASRASGLGKRFRWRRGENAGHGWAMTWRTDGLSSQRAGAGSSTRFPARVWAEMFRGRLSGAAHRPLQTMPRLVVGESKKDFSKRSPCRTPMDCHSLTERFILTSAFRIPHSLFGTSHPLPTRCAGISPRQCAVFWGNMRVNCRRFHGYTDIGNTHE